MIRIIGAVVIGGMCLIGSAEGAELASESRDANGQPRTFNWQDREFFGASYVYRTLGGGDAAAGESGDAGAATGTGDGGGSTGGNSGESCGDSK